MGRSDNDNRAEHLSRITTLWSAVCPTRAPTADEQIEGHCRLLKQYQAAVYAYLLGAVRNADVADELFQEFALRVVRGDFSKTNPERGRFRDYLRTALIHLITDYYRERNAWPKRLAENAAASAVEAPAAKESDFIQHWRDEILERTWQALAEAQPTYHAVLLFRVQNPDVPSPQMAAELSRHLGKPMEADGVRKALQRAHAKFADLLLDEVAASLGGPTNAELEAELRELDLLRYCRPALAKRSKA
ncbi:MAG TPA: sigma-70 family RNA polymerase sigma factor [Gemmataceae bacterium]|jgi:RNA polymerase sigma-70 factor (ECF subfamily)|nr:sigma-70 family RNA polymerase sigma factor [Gemmataceae bacterium]